MYNTYFYIIIAIIVIDFLFERYLDYINIKHKSEQLPAELQGIYDEQKYKKQRRYKVEKYKFGLLSSSISFVVILLMLFLGGFGYIDKIAWNYTDNSIVAALIFFGIIFFASDILSLPFSIYSTFVIEQKYGFNKTTPRTFIFDKIKGWIVTAIIGGGLFALIIFIYQQNPESFWWYAWIVITVFSVFMAMFYSNLIVPLFNKQEPLPSGELRDSIEKFAAKVGFNLKNIFVINGSKRSTKANAYFTGLGGKKRIVLYDTLLEDMENDELVAILAHEIGHYKKKHVLQNLIISTLQTGLLLFLFSIFVDNSALSEAFNVSEPNFHIGLIAFGMLYSPISFLLGIVMNKLSRKNEYQADKFAAINFAAKPLYTALKKLSDKNLSNLTPHPKYVYFHYSHPTLLQRLRHLKTYL